MVLEQLDKVWLNRRVRANPHGKFVLSKKVKVLAEAAPSGKWSSESNPSGQPSFKYG